MFIPFSQEDQGVKGVCDALNGMTWSVMYCRLAIDISTYVPGFKDPRQFIHRPDT
jgi:hypothetical protein